jgi:hypothetical protein
MRKTIWKFPLPSNPSSQINLPGRMATPLYVNFDSEGVLCLWAEVDSDDVCKRRVLIEVVSTGQGPLANTSTYMNTVIRNGLVFHMYYALS